MVQIVPALKRAAFCWKSNQGSVAGGPEGDAAGPEGRAGTYARMRPRLLDGVEKQGMAATLAIVFDGEGFDGGPAGELKVVADDAGAGA